MRSRRCWCLPVELTDFPRANACEPRCHHLVEKQEKPLVATVQPGAASYASSHCQLPWRHFPPSQPPAAAAPSSAVPLAAASATFVTVRAPLRLAVQPQRAAHVPGADRLSHQPPLWLPLRPHLSQPHEVLHTRRCGCGNKPRSRHLPPPSLSGSVLAALKLCAQA